MDITDECQHANRRIDGPVLLCALSIASWTNVKRRINVNQRIDGSTDQPVPSDWMDPPPFPPFGDQPPRRGGPGPQAQATVRRVRDERCGIRGAATVNVRTQEAIQVLAVCWIRMVGTRRFAWNSRSRGCGTRNSRLAAGAGDCPPPRHRRVVTWRVVH